MWLDDEIHIHGLSFVSREFPTANICVGKEVLSLKNCQNLLLLSQDFDAKYIEYTLSDNLSISLIISIVVTLCTHIGQGLLKNH